MAEKPRTISGGDSESEIIHDIMNLSQISQLSNDSISHTKSTNLNITHNLTGKSSCRFPKLEECAHFHYERVQLGKIAVRIIDDKYETQTGSNISQISDTISQTKSLSSQNGWFIIRVSAGRSEPFLIRRSLDNLKMLDELLHQCVYDRKISGLDDLKCLEITDNQLESIVSMYLVRFSSIASDSMTCGPVLTWLQLDNKGRRLPVVDSDTMRSINTPAVGAAYGVRRYTAQACDEISIEVGDMISVIDMPSPAESVWWRGKKSHLQKSQYEVGFFPQSCVATIGDKVPRHMPLPAPLVGSLAVSPTKPVLRKHGKLIAFFRSFILSRPSRRRLKQSGIYKERVFSCDLSEHLLNSGQDIPMVLKCCAEFIEKYGIVDGIYRLSGITSNIQKLRRAFDEERVPDLTHPEIRQDIHAVSSLLKMYFRELPNPLCTYQLYDNFVDAIQSRSEGEEHRLKLMRETVQKLPPPHYRTLKYLSTHLNKISRYSDGTGMTDRNLAIVWAPNLLRSPALESGGVAALRGVGVQAVVTEYLITNCEHIFNSDDDFTRFPDDSLTDCDSYTEHRCEQEQSLSLERPKSLNVGGAKLLSLEEAQSRHNRSDNIDINKSITTNTSALQGAYIEVGGGPSSLPDKYHTVLPVPRSWQKRKTHSWKSLFSRAPRQSNSNQDIKGMNVITPTSKVSPIDMSNCGNTTLIEEKELTPVFGVVQINQQGKNTKGTDLYDGKSITTMDICVRSNSIDSLRTAGHSRSVSHDSYFDLLQSPLRAVTTCPSREFSELGLNFDREEPDLRIFSESESLVSSPKIIKETTRRVMRARPEEFSSTANSVNPSPKKQPRLNFQSPTETLNWANIDESSCKRYKLEDQLSDIQFIDCNTPEHTISNPTNQSSSSTIYTSVQIHNPPSSLSSTSHEVLNNKQQTSDKQLQIKTMFIKDGQHNNHETMNRYSYPGNRNDNNCKNMNNDSQTKERFSYPVIGSNNKMNEEKKVGYNILQKDNNIFKVNIGESKDWNRRNHNEKEIILNPLQIATIQNKNRYSFYEQQPHTETLNDTTNGIIVLRSNSAETFKKNEINRSKLSVATPQSPVQSPRYSLLVGDTSSENSSSLNTPIYDMDMSSSVGGGGGGGSGSGGVNILSMDQKLQDNNSDCENSNSRLSTTSFDTKDSINLSANNTNTNESKPDISALKNDLSLDLSQNKNCSTKINVPSTPNTPNHTHTSDNTSQSMTPSEFGYQNLNRNSNVVSLESSPKTETNIYDNLEQAFHNYDNIRSSMTTTTIGDLSPIKGKLSSPIRATINITYKAPVKKYNDESELMDSLTSNDTELKESYYEDVATPVAERNEQKTNLLETNFDDKMVYEQVKFFKSTILEINDMIDNGNVTTASTQQQVVPNLVVDLDSRNKNDESNDQLAPPDQINNENEDIPMTDSDVIQDSLEFDQHFSLYENVHVTQPSILYENVELTSKTKIKYGKENETPIKVELKPGNFIVRQLATKFETSPVDTMPPFDFSKPYLKKTDANRNSPCAVRAKNSKQLHKTSKITRSLDENAFIREFGSQKKLENINQSTQQIHDIGNILSENNPSRRKSMEFTRPKSLNQPKRLPNLTDSETTEVCKTPTSINSIGLKLNLTTLEMKLDETNSVNVKITPTTENRISLIQQNVMDCIITKNSDDEKSVTSLSSIKVLENCKLDRDRIEKIKEERRHQLSEKFRSESFKGNEKNYNCMKSKSKTELRDLKDTEKSTIESLRLKSKSRCDVRIITDNNIETKILPTTITNNYGCRIRRSSDEKNQNDCVVGAGTTTTPTGKTSTINNDVVGRSENLILNENKYDFKSRIKLEKRGSIDYHREREQTPIKCSQTSQRDKISPQRSIRDVAAMFESRLQNQ